MSKLLLPFVGHDSYMKISVAEKCLAQKLIVSFVPMKL
jgi:hypothetical protein